MGAAPQLQIYWPDSPHEHVPPPVAKMPTVETEPTNVSFLAACERYRNDAKNRVGNSTWLEYRTTATKLETWWKESPLSLRCPTPKVELLDYQSILAFVTWVYEQSKADAKQKNPGRTANKALGHIGSVLRYLCRPEVAILKAVPAMPGEFEQRSEAGTQFFTFEELDRIYEATQRWRNPGRWSNPLPIGDYWRAALAMGFTYGVDTGLLFPTRGGTRYLAARDIYFAAECPSRQTLATSDHGWIYYQRQKTKKKFLRPMTAIVRAHLEVLVNASTDQAAPLFGTSGGSKPCVRFRQLLAVAKIKPKVDLESHAESEWMFKDLRKTCATYHEQTTMGASSVILGHSGESRGMSRVTEKHYADLSPIERKALAALQYPPSFHWIFKRLNPLQQRDLF